MAAKLLVQYNLVPRSESVHLGLIGKTKGILRYLGHLRRDKNGTEKTRSVGGKDRNAEARKPVHTSISAFPYIVVKRSCSGCRESDPGCMTPSHAYYHYTTARNEERK